MKARVHFQPLACFFGGVVAQEIVKITGKYTPISQWLHIDALEVLPNLDSPLSSPPLSTPIGISLCIFPLHHITNMY